MVVVVIEFYFQDYCVISKKDVDFELNPNEIEDYYWLKLSEIDTFMNESEITPWFKLIYESGLLENWWKNLDNLNSISSTDILIL